jgi:hypothetical protein
MKSGDPAEHKPVLLSLRSAVVLSVALLVAIAAGGLLFAAHRSMAQGSRSYSQGQGWGQRSSTWGADR